MLGGFAVVRHHSQRSDPEKKPPALECPMTAAHFLPVCWSFARHAGEFADHLISSLGRGAAGQHLPKLWDLCARSFEVLTTCF